MDEPMTKDNKEKKPVHVEDISEFFTVDAANEGVRVPLVHPRTGEVTDQWVHVLGQDSDGFRMAEAKSRRRAREKMQEMADSGEEVSEDAQVQMMMEDTIELVACLVKDWSFPIPCTPENVKDLLRKSPPLREAIDLFAARRANFTKGVSGGTPST